MAHYPIKCIRCTHIATNDTVLFDTEDTIQSMTHMLAQENTALSIGKRAKKDRSQSKAVEAEEKGWWEIDDDETDALNQNGEDGTGQIELGRLMTYPAMREYCEENGLGEVTPEWQSVNVTPDFLGKDIDDPGVDLLVGFSFKSEVDGVRKRARKRYCPACHCELPSQSGAMPTYVITVMGTSASGKTVYLCALHWLLSHGTGNMPYHSSLSCVTASRNGNTVYNLSMELFERGILPGTTQIVLTEPLAIQLTYEIGGSSKKCLFALADMRGEDLASDDGSNLLLRSEFFSRADGFMVLISPLNIPALAHRFSQYGGAEGSTAVHTVLMQNINDYILPSFPGGQIIAPAVVMLSKSDLLINNASYLQIPRYNAVVAPNPPIMFTGTYFQSQYNGTRQIVSADAQLHQYLNNCFSDPYYTSISSLGPNVNVGTDTSGNRIITNPNLINPLRVVDPVIYLLMRFGFLPAFYKMEAGQAYEAENVAIISEWLQTHT